MNLYVSNISPLVNTAALKSLFSEFGAVRSVVIILDKVSGRSKGYGFVEMHHDIEAINVINKLNNAQFFGQRLLISKARPNVAQYQNK